MYGQRYFIQESRPVYSSWHCHRCAPQMRGMSQEQLAEKAGISRSLISAIEAPGLAKSFSLDVFFNLADALDIDPADLINATVFPDRIFKQK